MPGHSRCRSLPDSDKEIPANISPEEQKRLTQQISAAVDTDVIPAYKTFAAFLRTEYAPHGRTPYGYSLPDSEKRYQNDIYGRTTTHMRPDEIHQLGLREIDRIQGEMTVIAKKEGFSDLASFRASLKTNPKYNPPPLSRFSTTFAATLPRWSPNCPSSSLFSLSRP